MVSAWELDITSPIIIDLQSCWVLDVVYSQTPGCITFHKIVKFIGLLHLTARPRLCEKSKDLTICTLFREYRRKGSQGHCCCHFHPSYQQGKELRGGGGDGRKRDVEEEESALTSSSLTRS